MDNRDFTVFAERHDQQEIATYLNAVADREIQVVVEYYGVVLHLLRDGIMVVFGALIKNNAYVQFATTARKERLMEVNN